VLANQIQESLGGPSQRSKEIQGGEKMGNGSKNAVKAMGKKCRHLKEGQKKFGKN